MAHGITSDTGRLLWDHVLVTVATTNERDLTDIKNAVVLVTGASSGIGAATARAASRDGAQLVLIARREDRIRQLAEELGDAIPVRCDVTDARQVATAVDAAISAFGRIDVLIDNAGQGLQAPIEEVQPDDFRALLELNLVAPLLTMQAVIPVMRKQAAGGIVNVSSGTTFSALPASGAYAASKAGLNMLSAVARVDLEHRHHRLHDVSVPDRHRVRRLDQSRQRGRIENGLQRRDAATAARTRRPGHP